MTLDVFLDYLKNTRNMSENTIEAYKRDIMAFREFAARSGVKDLQDVTNTNIVAYLLELKNSGKSKSTVSRKLASLRAFYRYLQNRGIIEENPTDDIRSPKIGRKKISYFSVESVEKLLSLPDDSIKGKRDRAILELMYATGIRVSEIIEMRLSDLNLKVGFVALNGKHGGARIVPMGRPARRAVTEYIETSRRALMKDGDPEDPAGILFVNYLGQPFTRQGFWKILKKYGEEAHLEEKLTPQTLRNSFAMHMVQNGIDIKSLQELMGHEDIAATQMYFGDVRNRIKDIYDRCHPRAK